MGGVGPERIHDGPELELVGFFAVGLPGRGPDLGIFLPACIFMTKRYLSLDLILEIEEGL